MRTLDDLGLLRLFAAVVDTGSLSAAARQLGTTLPAVSRKLRQLELSFAVRLLHRTTRRQALTEEGELLYRHAVRVLEELDQVEQQLLRKSTVVSGQLRITAPISLGRRRIAPLMARFSDRHPELQVQLDLTDTVLDLVAAGIDVAVRFGAMEDSSYVSRPLAPNHRVLCASPAYLARHGVPREPADLVHHRCLLIGQQPQADWRFDDVTVRVNTHLAANDGEVVHLWALEGHGIAMKSIWDVHHDLASGRLRQVLPGHRVPAAPLHAVYPHRRHVAPRVHACIDFLARHLQGPETGIRSVDDVTGGVVGLSPLASTASQGLEGQDAERRHHQGSGQVGGNRRHGPAQPLGLDQLDDFGRKGREGGEAAEEAGDDQQAPFRRDARVEGEPGHGDADQITADQIRRQRAQRQQRKQRIEGERQLPAGDGADRGTEADRGDGFEHGSGLREDAGQRRRGGRGGGGRGERGAEKRAEKRSERRAEERVDEGPAEAADRGAVGGLTEASGGRSYNDRDPAAGGQR